MCGAGMWRHVSWYGYGGQRTTPWSSFLSSTFPWLLEIKFVAAGCVASIFIYWTISFGPYSFFHYGSPSSSELLIIFQILAHRTTQGPFLVSPRPPTTYWPSSWKCPPSHLINIHSDFHCHPHHSAYLTVSYGNRKHLNKTSSWCQNKKKLWNP